MKNIELFDFKEERICIYKDEQYRVRDNGFVMRFPKEKKRPLDEKWTLGKVGQHGYLYIGRAGVHRIVATAFHEKPSAVKEDLVVDHIDTNRQNNRPENLRWLTREQNILNNENTVRKIEYRLGKEIHEVLQDPDMLRHLPPCDNSWCRPTTVEEAKNLRVRQELWNQRNDAGLAREEADLRLTNNSSGLKDGGVFAKPRELAQFELITRPNIHPNDRQEEDFYYPMSFPCRPEQEGDHPLEKYLSSLDEDTLFSECEWYSTYLINAQIHKNEKRLIVVTLGIQRDNPEKTGYYIFDIEYVLGGYFYRKPECFAKEAEALKIFNYLCGNIEFDYDDEDLFNYVHFC